MIWDVTNGYEECYGEIVDELLNEITPNYIVVPVGSGGIYVGIINRIKELGLNTKVIGIGVKDKSNSIADKLTTTHTPYSKVMDQFEKEGNVIYNLDEEEVVRQYEESHYIITSEPSSTVVFTTLKKHKFKPKDTIVFINTGRSKFSSRSDSRFFLTHFGE